MAFSRCSCLLNCKSFCAEISHFSPNFTKKIYNISGRSIFKLNFSTSIYMNNSWRKSKGLEPCPRQFSPLTQLPDYSFVDGRPVPLSLNKRRKLDIQKKYCEKIVELSTEIDIGLEVFHNKEQERKQEMEKILRDKLKPKGEALLRKTETNLNADMNCNFPSISADK